MPEKTWIVRFKPPEDSVQPVRAARAEVVDDCLVFFGEDGTMVAFFLSEIVDSWAVDESSTKD